MRMIRPDSHFTLSKDRPEYVTIVWGYRPQLFSRIVEIIRSGTGHYVTNTSVNPRESARRTSEIVTGNGSAFLCLASWGIELEAASLTDNKGMHLIESFLATRKLLTNAEISAELKRFDTRSPSVREDAIHLLLTLEDEFLVPLLLDCFSELRTWQARADVLQLCCEAAAKDLCVVEVAIRALNDRARAVRHWACAALACSFREEAIPHLENLRFHQDFETRTDAINAIQGIQRKSRPTGRFQLRPD